MVIGKAKVFLAMCLSFLAGVAGGRYLKLYLMAIVAAGFIILITVFWSHQRAKLIGFLGLVFLLGALRYIIAFPYDDPRFIGRDFGKEVTITGIIVREPDVRGNKTNLTVRPDGYQGQILVNASRYPEYQYGDKLQVSGKLEEPFENEDFSYKNYLSRFDTYAVVRFPKIEKIGDHQGNVVIARLFGIKAKFVEAMSQLLGEPHNALALGIIIGAKRAIPDHIKDMLTIVGISHIIVVSGYNISIITKTILRSRSWFGRRAAFVLASSAILAFIIISGAEASIIRAGIMGLLMIVAMNTGRLYGAYRILILAAALMVLQNPKILYFDIGFQLSFLATLGLVFLSPIFEEKFSGLPNWLWIRTSLSATLAALIFTMPLLSFYFDRLSLVAVLVNVLVVWIVPYAMFFAFFTGFLGALFLPLGKILAPLLWVMLEYIFRISELFAKVPYAAVSWHMSLWLVFIYYLILGLGLYYYRNRKKFFYQLEYFSEKI